MIDYGNKNGGYFEYTALWLVEKLAQTLKGRKVVCTYSGCYISIVLKVPKTSIEFLIDQNKLISEFLYVLSQYNSTWSLILARHEVKRIDTILGPST